MQHIMVTTMPELVSSPVSRFLHSFTLYDIINTVITLGALAFAFFMFYSFSKYGKYGRDVSKETQDHDKQSLVDHGLIDPVDHRPVTQRQNQGPANKPKAQGGSKPRNTSVKYTVKNTEIKRGGE